MSKKTIKRKRNARVPRKLDGNHAAKKAGIFSLLSTTIARVWQKIWQMAIRAKGKGKEDVIKVPGSTWVLGSSPNAAANIAGAYDKSENPEIHSGPTNDE